MTLRPYQQAAIEQCRAQLRAGHRAIVLVSPTGSGKTRMGAEIARLHTARGGTTVWLTHRRELAMQAAAALGGAGRVCMMDTLIARGERPMATMVIVDECHHASADTYSALLDSYRGAIVIGLTATPERGDGRGLAPRFTALVTAAQPAELVAAGHLVDCEILAPAATLRPGQIARRPVEAYLEHGGGRPALVFSPTLAMARLHAEEMQALGVHAAIVDGAMPEPARDAALAAFRTGAIRVLVNVGVLTEGTDLPMAAVCILARGCGTAGLYMQIVGRVLRPLPGKARATLLDLRGVSHVHGSPLEDRVYSLEGRAIRRQGEADTRYCLTCGAIMETPPCAECGATASTAKPLRVTGEKLEPYAAARRSPPERKAYNLTKWLEECRAKNWKPGRAFVIYQRVYGAAPTEEIRAMARAKQ